MGTFFIDLDDFGSLPMAPFLLPEDSDFLVGGDGWLFFCEVVAEYSNATEVADDSSAEA